MPADSTLRGFLFVYNNLDDGHQAIDALAESRNFGRLAANLEHLGFSCDGLKDGTTNGSFLYDTDLKTLSSLELPTLKSLRCDSVRISWDP